MITHPLNILGIETSCDDTGAAIISSNAKILSNIVISQNNEHQIYKGVVPEIAARSHLNNLEYTIKLTLEESELSIENIDAFAATSGPGLIGGVIVGCVMAKALASRFNKPFIAVNHLEGHALTARLSHNVAYPYLLLLASGGHCQFIAVESLGKYRILGQTLDDAAGEAFDKVAKMLGLAFPGGPEIEKCAILGDPHKYPLPRPIINRDNCDMSFSGLKTAVRLLIANIQLESSDVPKQDGQLKSLRYRPDEFKDEAAERTTVREHSRVPVSSTLRANAVNDIAASFQYAACEILVLKTLKAIQEYQKYYSAKKLVIAGGVAANKFLSVLMHSAIQPTGFELIVPPMKLCTDNAAMIAYAGLERLKAGLVSSLDFCPRARWGLEEIE